MWTKNSQTFWKKCQKISEGNFLTQTVDIHWICTQKIIRGAPDLDPDPDPAGSNVSGSSSDPDPAGSEVGSGKYWPDLQNYDIKHHSILSFQEMMHDNTELYTKTHKLSHFSSMQLMSDTNYHLTGSSVTKLGKQSFQFLPVVVEKE